MELYFRWTRAKGKARRFANPFPQKHALWGDIDNRDTLDKVLKSWEENRKETLHGKDTYDTILSGTGEEIATLSSKVGEPYGHWTILTWSNDERLW